MEKEYTYRFAVQKRKVEETRAHDPFYPVGRIGYRDEEVFSAEINADEMVELMQHLWEIAKRRKSSPIEK